MINQVSFYRRRRMSPSFYQYNFAVLIALLCIHHSVAQLFFPSEDQCITPQDEEGVCTSLAECHTLRHIRDYNFLRRFICGFSGNSPLLCCPRIRITTPRPTRPTRPTRRPTRPPTRAPTQAPTQAPLPPTQAPQPVNPDTPKFRKPNNLPDKCGVSTAGISRIVGGRESEVGAWPWMAAIYVRTGNQNVQFCGGALVTHRHVVTAAHCVVVGERSQSLPPNILTIRLGDHNLEKTDDVPPGTTVDVNVIKIVRHEDFNPKTFKNDICIMTLGADVVFTKYIQPVCLPYDAIAGQDLVGYHPIVTGWGYTKYNGESSDVLKEAQITIWAEDQCKNSFKKEVTISQEYLCAGEGDGSKDSCQGDSGGPLVLPNRGKFYLIGVVSFGKYCATPGYPGVYTRVTNYLDWITKHLEE